ncbi:hypothetical protein niasHT_031160 [Heterodera trifolii]|uniref:Uncharacterized protein n=1 Tax=Heterodera trifolii TaxID=157864 RepID=A0ABD2I2F7_9BILA
MTKRGPTGDPRLDGSSRPLAFEEAMRMLAKGRKTMAAKRLSNAESEPWTMAAQFTGRQLLAEGKQFPSPKTCHQPLEAADMARENQWEFSPMPFPWPFSHDQKANLIKGPRPLNGSQPYIKAGICHVPTSFHTPTMPKPIKMHSSSSSAYSSSSSSLSSSPDRQSPPPSRKKAVEKFNITAATPEREAKSGRKFSVRDFIDAEAKD